jgi:hypothetical protein
MLNALRILSTLLLSKRKNTHLFAFLSIMSVSDEGDFHSGRRRSCERLHD